MKVDDGVVITDDEADILRDYEELFRENYGEKFHLKKDGVLEFILKIAAKYEKNLQENIKYLARQFDTTKTEGIWQDYIFGRLGFSRFNSDYAHFEAVVRAESGKSLNPKEIKLREELSGEEFYNTTSVTFDLNGERTVRFQAKNSGKIPLTFESKFTLISSPSFVLSVAEEISGNIFSGAESESDEDFRRRYERDKCISSSSTADAVFATLLNYVDNSEVLKILSKKDYQNIPVGCLKIIAKPNVEDEIFAQAIFNSISDGIGLIGDCETVLQDSLGTSVSIKFTKPELVESGMDLTISFYDKTVSEEKISSLKNEISEIISSKNFGLGASVYAPEISSEILKITSVKNVIEGKVFRVSDGEFLNKLEFGIEEIPKFSSENISIKIYNE